ncbi:MAG: hypothetical protein OXJ55_09010 [Caldilineaceae bacterium]|nr:hypothetical protein [Caldilineaceae bacterium]
MATVFPTSATAFGEPPANPTLPEAPASDPNKPRTDRKAVRQALIPTTKTDTEHLTVSDFDATRGENPDPTGDFAAGRTHVFLDSDEFIATSPADATATTANAAAVGQ